MTDKEIIRAVAEKVMGWEKAYDAWIDKKSGLFKFYSADVDFETNYAFDPFTNANHRDMVVEKMVKDNWFFRLCMAPNGVITARFWWPTHDDYPKDFLQESDNQGHAICLSALKAKGVEA